MPELAAYSFDEETGDALDYSGNGHHFSLGANGTRAAGHTGTAATKSGGGGELVSLPAGLLAAVNASTSRTLMAWIKGNGGTWYVRCNHDDIDSGGWGFLNLTSTTIGPRARNAGGLAQFQTAIPGGGADWYHLAASYDDADDTLRTFIGGELVDARTLAGPLRSDADSLDIMEWSDGGTLLDDLRFFDHAITEPAEIAELAATPVAEAATITGTAAFTSPGGELAAAGTAAVAGAAGLIAPAAAVEGTGTVVVTGAVAVDAPAGQLEATGRPLVAGTAALVSPAPTLAGAGRPVITGTAAFVAPAAVLTGRSVPATVADRRARTTHIPAEPRRVVVPAESRTVSIPAET